MGDKLKNGALKLLKDGFGHIFIANIVNQLISFLSSFILIRILSKYDYGVYSYALNVYSIFALLNGFGMEAACLQLGSEQRKDTEKTDNCLKYGITVGCIFNLFLAVAILICASVMPLKINDARIYIMMFAAMPLFTTLFNCIQAYFRYNLLNSQYARLMVFNTACIVAGSVAGALLWETTGLILLREAGMLLSVFWAVAVMRFPAGRILKAGSISKREKRDMLNIAFVSMMNVATGQLLYLLDVFLVGLLIADATVVASYKTATILPNAILFIPNALAVYIYPHFAEHKDDIRWVRNRFFTILKYFAPVNILISLGMIVFAPLIIRILFGAQYLDAVPAFRILSLSYFFSATFRKIVGNLLVTQRKLNVNFWLGIAESLLNIVSNWILIHLMGAIGAAVTTLTICVLSSAFSTIYFLRYLKRKEQQC